MIMSVFSIPGLKRAMIAMALASPMSPARSGLIKIAHNFMASVLFKIVRIVTIFRKNAMNVILEKQAVNRQVHGRMEIIPRTETIQPMERSVIDAII